MTQELSPFDCTRCEGKGYILDHHERLTCRSCEGRGIITYVVSPRLKEIRWKRQQIDFSLKLWREDLKKNKATIKRLVEGLSISQGAIGGCEMKKVDHGHCRKCKTKLILGQNWTLAFEKAYNYLCSDCALAYCHEHRQIEEEDFEPEEQQEETPEAFIKITLEKIERWLNEK